MTGIALTVGPAPGGYFTTQKFVAVDIRGQPPHRRRRDRGGVVIRCASRRAARPTAAGLAGGDPLGARPDVAYLVGQRGRQLWLADSAPWARCRGPRGFGRRPRSCRWSQWSSWSSLRVHGIHQNRLAKERAAQGPLAEPSLLRIPSFRYGRSPPSRRRSATSDSCSRSQSSSRTAEA